MIILRKLITLAIKMNNWMLFWVTTSLILFSSFFIVYLEPDTFETPMTGFWWVMTTVTTVGYGDYSPVTTEGRLFAILLYLLGIGLIGVVIGKIVDWFTSFRKKKEEGMLAYKGSEHFVIIGWSTKAKYAVEEILETSEDKEIVIIDNLEVTPYAHDRLHYVKGHASEEITLDQANVREAKAVLIFADDAITDSQLADGKTLLIASTIEYFAPRVHTTVEILHEDHVKNFKHVNVDEFVIANETISRLAVRSAFTKGISAVYSQLMSRKHGDDLYQIKKRPHWNSYRDAFEELLKEGATLISDKENLDINRRLDEPIPDHALLYVICDDETYQTVLKSS